MIRIGDAVVSLDVIERYFCCDIADCKGACCIEGDAGALITDEEEEALKASLPFVKEYLSPQALQVIQTQGVSYTDIEGDLVTSVIGNRDCVFCTYTTDGICLCALEKICDEGKIPFKKPVSCHLYPVRITRYPNFTAVNYDRRTICSGAEKKGKALKIRVYQFLKVPLIRYKSGTTNWHSWQQNICGKKASNHRTVSRTKTLNIRDVPQTTKTVTPASQHQAGVIF